MAYTRAADGITQQGKTAGKVLASDGPNQAIQNGGKGGKGGKTDADLLKLGRGLAKVANQKRG